MFGFRCNNTSSASRISSILELYALQNRASFSSFRYMSGNEDTTNQRSFVVSYLVNSCGLTPKSALSASKQVNFKTPKRPDSVISSFKNHGFSETQISQLVKKYPRVLSCNPEKTILPKFEFFRSQGLSSSDIAHFLSDFPYILRSSLENRISPSFNFLRDLIKSDKFLTTFKISFSFLAHDLETELAPKIKLLRDIGVPEPNVLKLFKYSYQGILFTKFERFKENAEEAKKLGFNPSQSRFVPAVAILSMIKSRWEMKVNVFKRWDWCEEEIIAAFRKQPNIMVVSEDKIATKLDLFVNKLGWQSSLIAKNPVLLCLSLEKRLIPRASVLQHLLSKGLLKKDYRATHFFICPETKFLQKFIDCYDEAPDLLKLYGKKSALSK